MYEYSARMIDNYDGDTMTAEIVLLPDQLEDLGFGIHKNFYETATKKFRLYGVNAPEVKAAGPEGEQAREWLREWFADHVPEGVFTLNTFKTSSANPDDKQEKYGRYLAIVTAPDGRRLNDDLITSGHGVPFMVT